MKKIVSAVILAGIITGALVSCGGGKDSSKDEEKAIDLGGYEFVLASHWINEYEPKRGDSPLGDSYLDLIDDIQKKYNCKITTKGYAVSDTIAEEVHTSIMAGDKPFDVMDVPTKSYASLLVAGDLFNQSTIKSLDLKNKNFNQSVTAMGTWNGKVYGSNFGLSNNVSGLFFNATMLQKKNLENPYELYKQDKWTFTKFKEMLTKLKEDTNGDGTPEIYGMVGNIKIEEDLLFSAGFPYVTKNKDGKYVFGLNNPGAIETVNYIRSLYKDNLIHPEKDWQGVGMVFAEKEAAFLPYFVWAAQWFTELDDDFGFVPMPRGDNVKEYVAYSDEPRMFVMPKTLKDPEKTGVIYNQLSKLVAARDEALIKTLKDYGFDDQGIDMFKELSAMTKLNPAVGVDITEAKLSLNYACQDATAEPASKFAEIDSMLTQKINDYYSKLPK